MPAGEFHAVSATHRPAIPALTSLRFFAALWVVLFHVREVGLFRGGIAPYAAVVKLGYLGVSFFFVLSGFILVYVYAGREIQKARFWQARLARVYPAYLFSLLVMAPSIPAFVPLLRAMHGSLVIAVTSFPMLLEAWFPRDLLFWNVVAWSLSVEAFFYFLFPFAQRLLERTNSLGLRFWLVGSWASSLAITFAYVALKPDGVEWPTSKDTTLFWLAVIKFNPVVRLPEFLLGMGVGAKFLRDRERPRSWPIAVGFILLLLGTIFQQRIPYAMMHSGLPGPAFGLLIYGFATLPASFRFLHSKFDFARQCELQPIPASLVSACHHDVCSARRSLAAHTACGQRLCSRHGAGVHSCLSQH
ncbi:MAG: acyltransferase family protein [Janthinobacterium lividum]